MVGESRSETRANETESRRELVPDTFFARESESHKGTYGRVVVVGGSRGMAGACALAGKAALRSGAGLVTLVVPRGIQATAAGFEPAIMTLGLGNEKDDALVQADAKEVLRLTEQANVIALGPGIGTSPGTVRLVQELYHRAPQPMVVDADALNALAQHPEALGAPGGSRILTPHPGEFARLTGADTPTGSDRRAESAAELSRRDGSGRTVVVLKGHETVIAEGDRIAVNTTGNPGMATGGTGDCLTGVIAALVGQGIGPWEAARLGVYVHGLAGDLAAEELGQISMTASDLVEYLPRAFQKLATQE